MDSEEAALTVSAEKAGLPTDYIYMYGHPLGSLGLLCFIRFYAIFRGVA